jgi:hypothetical protein
MNWMRFNTNESVRVKLTEVGLVEFKRKAEELNARLPAGVAKFPTEPRLDEDGYYTDQMWSVMNDFGHGVRPTR